MTNDQWTVYKETKNNFRHHTDEGKMAENSIKASLVYFAAACI